MRRAFWAGLCALWLLLSLPWSGLAEGPGTGGRRVIFDDRPAGPYLLRVVTSPTPPRPEKLYLEVRVTDASSGGIVTDAEVMTSAVYQDGDSPRLDVIATHDIAPVPDEYASHLPVPLAGVWNVIVKVDGELGVGETEFLLRVSPDSAIGTVIAVGLPIAGLALLVIIFLMLGRKEEPSA